MIFRRFISFFGFSSEVVTAISWRISVAIFSRSSSVRIRRIASAPISAVNEILAVLVLRAQVLVLREELALLQRREAGLDDDVGLEVEDALEVLQRHVEQETDPARQRLEEPDVGDGRGELDMAHAVTPHARTA